MITYRFYFKYLPLFKYLSFEQSFFMSTFHFNLLRNETKLLDNQSLSRGSLSALIALQRKNAGFSATLQRSGLRDVSDVQNKPKESHTSSASTEDCIVIEDNPAVEDKQVAGKK